jgi:DNA invertase Pin-like site-specific DNA recombinase
LIAGICIYDCKPIQLDVTQPNDIILVEQIDRISRLNDSDWNRLKTIIKSKKLKIVSLDLPTSHQFVENT